MDIKDNNFYKHHFVKKNYKLIMNLYLIQSQKVIYLNKFILNSVPKNNLKIKDLILFIYYNLILLLFYVGFLTLNFIITHNIN